MKITCESCSAQYDLDDSRIPPSGLTMKCPACLHTFTVRKAAAAAPPPVREIALSDLSEVSADELGDADLPAPVGNMPARERDEDLLDLPAPVAPKPKPAAARPPAPPKPPEVEDLPAPVSALRKGKGGPPPPPAPDVADLPAPRLAKAPDLIDLPAPKSAATPRPSRDNADLLMPKGASAVGIGLDAPEADDLLEPVNAPLPVPIGIVPVVAAPPPTTFEGPPPVDLDALDVVAPKIEAMEIAPKPETMDVTPQTMDLAPQSMEVAPQTMDVSPVGRSEKPASAPDFRAPTATGEAAVPAPRFVPEEDHQSKRRLSRGLLVGIGALVLIAALGVSLGLFTSSGYFGVNLLTGKRAEVEAKLSAAHRLLAEDTLASYKRAANDLHPLVEGDAENPQLAGLEAQARLCAARLGLPSEGKSAEKLLAPFDANAKADAAPDVQKARALKLLTGGKIGDARNKLNALLQAAPADASALVYLGWTELAAGDWSAADKAFSKAVAAESNRAAALFGLGIAKEREGDVNAARDNYDRTLKKSASHFGAAVAMARLKKDDEQISKLIEAKTPSIGPRELADAWTARGIMAAEAGRREEAEDRFKRALQLDADSATARVLLSRVQCDLGHAAEAVPPLRKLLLVQPKNLEARLMLVRALLEGKTDNYSAEATTAMAPAVKDAPKDPRVLYWQGRLAVGTDKIDRDGALAKFKAAVEADPKLLDAYLAESAVLGQLGRGDDAIEILKRASAKAADDAQLQTELGAAYLGLGKPADAETQLRAALEKRPELFEARMYLGSVLEAEGKLADAAAQYAQVEEKSPKYPGLLERKGRLAVKQGNKDEAWKLFSQALANGSPTQSLRLAAADLALDLGKPDDAQKMGEAVVKDDERSAAAHLVLARAALAHGKPEDALPEARRSAMLGDTPESHLALGKSLEALGKLDQAVTEYQLARKGAVEAEAALGHARIMVRMGATKDALSELGVLAKDTKLRPSALVLMGDCYSDLQQPDKARHSYEDAVKYGPTLPDAAFKLGRSLHDAGKRPQAIAQLERAVKLGGDKAQFAPEAWLLLGDSMRENHNKDGAVKAYKKFLDLAAPEAPERAEVQKQLSILGGG
jgi:predicted Zn finger-like uncharacterized protein